MIVVGIDPGFAFLGIALVRFTASRAEALLVETFRTTTKDSDARRMARVADRLLEVCADPRIRALGFESQAGVEAGKAKRALEDPTKVTSNAASRRVHEVVGVVQTVARVYSLPCYEHAPSSVKVAMLGRGGGRASKSRMRDAAGVFFGRPGLSEHAADSLAVSVATARAYRLEQAKRRAGLSLIS